MRITHLIAIAFLIVTSGAASADYFFQQVSEAPTMIGGTSVACLEDGTVAVAWSVPPVGVFTRTFDMDMVFPPVFHGPGDMPSICNIAGKFFLAWAHEDSLKIRHSDSYDPTGWDWDYTHVYLTPSGEDVLFPHLTATGMPQGMLVWEERDEAIWKSDFHTMWFDPVYVAPPSSNMMSAPRLKTTAEAIRVYQMNEMNTCIDYSEGDFFGGDFTHYEILPGLGYFGSMYDVGRGSLGEQVILSMGPQPTCPCNTIVFTEETSPHVWSEPIHLTVPVDSYDFPQFPCIEADDDGTYHAYWFQSAHNDYLEETHRGLYYFTRGADLVWQDNSDIFGIEAGIWCSMDMGPMNMPIFVYAKGDYPDRQVWLGRDERLVTGIAETPAARLALSAAPNPFNPKTTLRFTLPEAGHAQLAIFDLSGRRVATLLDEPREAGEVVVEWKAKDLASGVYLAQATVPGYKAVEKLVLLK